MVVNMDVRVGGSGVSAFLGVAVMGAVVGSGGVAVVGGDALQAVHRMAKPVRT
jgi:hypothetical protein